MIKFKCPKCKGGNLEVTEAIIVNDCIKIEDGEVIGRWAGDGTSTLSFGGSCDDCGHLWRLRRKTGQDELMQLWSCNVDSIFVC